MEKRKKRRQSERSRHEWEYNIERNFKEVVWEGVEWTDHSQDSVSGRLVVSAVMNLRVS